MDIRDRVARRGLIAADESQLPVRNNHAGFTRQFLLRGMEKCQRGSGRGYGDTGFAGFLLGGAGRILPFRCAGSCDVNIIRVAGVGGIAVFIPEPDSESEQGIARGFRHVLTGLCEGKGAGLCIVLEHTGAVPVAGHDGKVSIAVVRNKNGYAFGMGVIFNRRVVILIALVRNNFPDDVVMLADVVGIIVTDDVKAGDAAPGVFLCLDQGAFRIRRVRQFVQAEVERFGGKLPVKHFAGGQGSGYRAGCVLVGKFRFFGFQRFNHAGIVDPFRQNPAGGHFLPDLIGSAGGDILERYALTRVQRHGNGIAFHIQLVGKRFPGGRQRDGQLLARRHITVICSRGNKDLSLGVRLEAVSELIRVSGKFVSELVEGAANREVPVNVHPAVLHAAHDAGVVKCHNVVFGIQLPGAAMVSLREQLC